MSLGKRKGTEQTRLEAGFSASEQRKTCALANTKKTLDYASEARMSNVQLGTSFDDLPCNVLSWFAARDS
jgi:hypothetical protein